VGLADRHPGRDRPSGDAHRSARAETALAGGRSAGEPVRAEPGGPAVLPAGRREPSSRHMIASVAWDRTDSA
jgi:hypothetical protein